MIRTVRNLDDVTKEKISNTLKNKPKASQTKEKISNSMKKYWSTIPVANPTTTQNNTDKNKPSNAIPTL